MSEKLNELKKKLREIFQLDQSDLDFGIYKIMNQKNAEITDFLNNKLLAQVKESFSDLANEDKSSVQKELDEAISQAKTLGANPDDLPKVKELKAQLANSVDVSLLENDVYSHLINFFSRYYNGGDFMSLRRYKKDVYAIPYEGEEVKLHWANSDQYYIKTSENFKDYSFFIGDDENKKTVHFKLVEAETEKDNNKSDKERRFMLVEESPVEVTDGELVIKFYYTIDENKKDQNKHNEQTAEKLLQELNKTDYSDFNGLLSLAPTEKNKNRTLLEKHLTDYTAKNSFDYFIHKDLKGFLDRELDFYIKNEVLNLDDLDDTNIKKSLGKAKAIKNIAKKLITFLGQLEDFQKKLWLKKKFVVETNYCITLDKIDKKFYPEILNNKRQIEEWEELFKISEIKADLTQLGEDVLLSGSDENKKLEFLKQNPYLQVDTKFFSNEFKYKLLATIDNLDEQINGLLINSDNFHALKLLQEKQNKQLKCIYIDPPYNTGGDGFLYRDSLKHSSWITMMENRLKLAKQMLSDDGVIFISIDDHEIKNLKSISDEIFGSENFVSILSVENNPKGRKNSKFISGCNDYCLVYAKDKNCSCFTENIPKNVKDLAEDEDGNYVHNSGKRVLVGKNEFNKIVTDYNSDKHYSVYYNETNKDMKFKQETSIFESDDILIQNGYKRYISYFKDSFVENTYTKNRIFELCSDNALDFKNEKIYEKNFSTTKRLKSIINNEKYKAVINNVLTDYCIDVKTTSAGTYLKDLFGTNNPLFSASKNVGLLKLIITLFENKNITIMDFFAGSGTTGHAVIELNRDDDGNRKYILCEMGKYFNTITKPRIQKGAYTKEWKTGKPVDRNGVSQIIKYISLESYEDACNNLTKKDMQLELSDKLEEEYKLNYMFDAEYADSLLNLKIFENPFDYKMNITQNNETKLVNIDLIETFNYLIGLNVNSIYQKDGFIIVEGQNLKEENILVIWRNIKEKSNDDLDEFLKKRKISTTDFEFDKIYVNGDNNLQNLKTDDENFKVSLIEEEFKNRMFDMQEV